MPLTKYDHIHTNRTGNDSTSTLRTAAVDITSFGIADNYTDNHILATLVKRDPLWLAIPLTILYASILIAGIIGNVVTCVVILRNKYLRTTTNYYLFSLAISDLLLLIFGLPQEMYYIWSRYPYIFGETFCILRGFMAETSTNASVLIITAFTVERYIAICHPFLAHVISTLSRAKKIIFCIWIIASVLAVPQAMQFGLVSHGGPELLVCSLKYRLIPNSFELSTLFLFIIPMIVITILYVCIGIKLKKTSTNARKRRVTVIALSVQTKQHHSSRSLLANGLPSRKILKMLVAVVITFFFCWAPFHCQRVIAMHTKTTDSKIYEVVTYISAILYYMSTTINPILYHTMSQKFRGAFKETARALCRKNSLTDNRSRLRSQEIRILNSEVRQDHQSSLLSRRSSRGIQ